MHADGAADASTLHAEHGPIGRVCSFCRREQPAGAKKRNRNQEETQWRALCARPRGTQYRCGLGPPRAAPVSGVSKESTTTPDPNPPQRLAGAGGAGPSSGGLGLRCPIWLRPAVEAEFRGATVEVTALSGRSRRAPQAACRLLQLRWDASGMQFGRSSQGTAARAPATAPTSGLCPARDGCGHCGPCGRARAAAAASQKAVSREPRAGAGGPWHVPCVTCADSKSRDPLHAPCAVDRRTRAPRGGAPRLQNAIATVAAAAFLTHHFFTHSS